MSLEEEWKSATPVDVTKEWETARPVQASQAAPSFLQRLAQTGQMMREAPGPRVAAALSGPMGLIQAGVGRAMENFSPETAYRAGGAVTDIATEKGASPEVAAGLGYATNVGLQAIPVVMGAGLGKTAGTQVGKRTGETLMQSALKPSKAALETGKAQRAIKTMLGEGINVTEGGAAKLDKMIDGINASIKARIANSPAMVNRHDVIKAVDGLTARLKMQVTPQSDLATVTRAIDEFVNNPLFKQWGDDIPVQLAQAMKTGTYRALGEKAYGELKGAEMEVQKALARGLKDEIAKRVPEVGKLNARESELLNAQSLVAARVLMAKNRDIGGLGWLISHPEAWIGWAADRSTLIKSLLARAAYRGGGVAGAAAGGGTAGAIQAIPGMMDQSNNSRQ